MQAHRGGLIVLFGLFGLVLCVPFALAAWVMGKNDLQAMNDGRMDRAGKQLTSVGRSMGMVGLMLAGIWALSGALWVITYANRDAFVPSEIASYKNVPRPPRDRMLAALATHGDDMWFFKMEGAEPRIAPLVEEYKKFLASLQFNEPDNVTWELPKGWQKEMGNEFRFATLRASPFVEISVTKLPKSSVLANVNRWRKQLTLPPLKAADLPRHVQKIQAKDEAEITLVDMVGEKNNDPPMMAAAPAEPVLTYKAPAGWVKVPPKIAEQKAAFEISRGEQKGRVTITSGIRGSMLDNVNRWRMQVELPPIEQEQLAGLLGKIKVADVDTVSIDLTGPKRADKFNRILVAIYLHGDLQQGGDIYFFRIDGPDDLIDDQRATFEAFLQSVRFDGEEAGEQQ